MGKNEARVKIGLEGEAEAKRKLKGITDGFKQWGAELAGIASGMATHLAGISAALGQVDPSRAAERFRNFRKTVTEQSIASGRSIDTLKSSFSAMSSATLLPDDQVADFAKSLSQATYDMGDSRKAIEALAGSGVATGRSLEQMGGIAETLHNSMGVGLSDIPDSLDGIADAAKALGTTGGPAALMDEVQALGGTLTQVASNGKKSMGELTAVMAAIGKGRGVEQAKQVQSQLLGMFTSGGEVLRRNLGIKSKDFYDENGQIKVNSANVKKLQDFYLKRSGGNVDQARQQASFYSPQLASALFRPGLIKDMEAAELAPKTHSGEAAMAALKASEHGKDTAAQLKREQEERENLGAKTNAAQQKVAGMLPENSITRMAVNSIGGGMAQAATQALAHKALAKAGTEAAKSLFSVQAAGDKAVFGLSGLAKGAGGALGKAGGVLAAGAIGYEIGTWLDKKTGASDKIAKVLTPGDTARQEKGEADHRASLASKRAATAARVAELEKGGMSHGQAVYAADHPGAAAPVKVETKIEIVNSSGHPIDVVQTQKGKSGQQ